LFHRESGLNVLFDEVSIPPSEWAVSPRYVSIALTNACDLRCPYCYASKRAARLPTAALREWLLELAAHECLGVGFGGGEPTLHPDFAALCQFTARETLMAVTFTTHAHRLEPVLVAQLAGAVHFIRVSVDGVGRTYEKARGQPFEALLRQLGVVRDLAPFGINVVVNAATVGELDRLEEIAVSAGARELLLLPERPATTTPGIDARSMARMAAWVADYRGPVPLAVSESAARALPETAVAPGETGLRAYAHVDAFGVLRPSSFDEIGVPVSSDGMIAAIRTLQNHLLGGTA
jgi:sulfatase maturation enzyme AslB (radical SAM superfamily)